MTSHNKSQSNKILVPAVVEMEEPLLETSSPTAAKAQEQQELCAAKQLNSQVRWHGAVIGALTQIINISGTAVIAYQWGPNAELFAEHANFWELPLHFLVYIVSQADLLLYVSMWLGLTAALTDRGIAWWRQLLGDFLSDRSIFVMGVQFYVGVVIGSFIAWFAMDFALGLPAPVYPMISVLFFGLFISYSMVWCFDLEQRDGEGDEFEVLHV